MPHTALLIISYLNGDVCTVRGYELVLFWGRGGHDSAWLIRLICERGILSPLRSIFQTSLYCVLYDEATTTGSCKAYAKLEVLYFELLCCLH